MGKILAFSGKAGSGKTTAATYLQEKFGGSKRAQRLSFAYELKARALEDFGDYLTSDDLVKNKTKEIVISGRRTTVRQLLIDIGMVYRGLDKDFWLSRLIKRTNSCLEHGRLALIDDMRFPNEYSVLKGMGAVLVRIERPGIPLIADESETSLDEHTFDYVVRNDGAVWQLHAELDRLADRLGLQEFV